MHFSVANPMAINCRADLSYNNPLRILLEPFHFNTPTVNKNASVSLIAPGSLFERVFPLAQHEIPKLVKASNDSYKFKTPMKFVEDQGLDHLPHLPIAMEAVEFWHATLRFVENFLRPFCEDAPAASDAGSSDDRSDAGVGNISAHSLGSEFGAEAALWEEHMREVMHIDADEVNFAELVCACIYTVTAHHNFVGVIGFDTLWNTPGGTLPGDTWEEILPTKNLFYTGFLLSALTDLRMPKIIEDFSVPFPDPKMKPAVEEWQREIHEISAHVQEYNQERSRPIPAFDPVLFECSVSV